MRDDLWAQQVFRGFDGKIGQALAQDYDFTEEVRGLQVPTLIVAARRAVTRWPSSPA